MPRAVVRERQEGERARLEPERAPQLVLLPRRQRPTSARCLIGRDSMARRSSAFRADAARESICPSRCAVAINRPSIAWRDM